MSYHVPDKDILLTVQFRHMRSSRAIQETAEQLADRLLAFVAPRATCEVVVDRMHPWKRGGAYDVSIRLFDPGRRLYVAHRSVSGTSEEVVYGALHEAFDEIRRQMQKQRTRRKRYRHQLAA